MAEHSFIADLTFQDLLRLRHVVRNTVMKEYPSHLMTDNEADKIIEAIGPVTRERLLKRAVDNGLV